MTDLLKHEDKLHPFPGHALHIQETVQFEVQPPCAVLLRFTSCQPEEQPPQQSIKQKALEIILEYYSVNNRVMMHAFIYRNRV